MIIGSGDGLLDRDPVALPDLFDDRSERQVGTRAARQSHGTGTASLASLGGGDDAHLSSNERAARDRARAQATSSMSADDGAARARCAAFLQLPPRAPTTTNYDALAREAAAFRALPASCNPFRVAGRATTDRLALADLLHVADALPSLLPALAAQLPEMIAAVRGVVDDRRERREPLSQLHVLVRVVRAAMFSVRADARAHSSQCCKLSLAS